jgi:hypothetical protein
MGAVRAVLVRAAGWTEGHSNHRAHLALSEESSFSQGPDMNPIKIGLRQEERSLVIRPEVRREAHRTPAAFARAVPSSELNSEANRLARVLPRRSDGARRACGIGCTMSCARGYERNPTLCNGIPDA